MPRLARTVCAHVPHHITQRGNRRDTRFYAAMPERSESDESRERGGRPRKPESEEEPPEDQNELPL